MEPLTPTACGPPPIAAVYDSIPTAFAALQVYTKAYGYAFIVRSIYPNKSNPIRIIYAYNRQDKTLSKSQNPEINPKRHRKGACSKRCGCTMYVVLRKDLISSQWKLEIPEGSHNHPASTDPSAHPAHRIAALEPTVLAQIERLVCSGLSNAQILAVIRHEYSIALLA